jgi:hypothetical protein
MVITTLWRDSSGPDYRHNPTLDQEGHHEREQSYALDERSKNDGRCLNATGHFRLPSHRLDCSPTDQTDAEASTDNRQAGTDRGAHKTK